MLPCMNCKTPIDDGKFFAEVWVCSDCHGMATRFYDKAQADMRKIMVMMKETIRIGLIEGKLQFAGDLETKSPQETLKLLQGINEQ